MMSAYLVSPKITFDTRKILQKNALLLVITFAFLCAVFVSTNKVSAPAPTTTSTEEHRELKVWSLYSSHFGALIKDLIPISS
jgi:hypothetical protein